MRPQSQVGFHYFEVHPETELLGVDELARRAGLSASRPSRLFEQQLGVSPTAVRNRHRLERFPRLYGRGRRVTMLAAALDANVGNDARFYRVFTRRGTGATRDSACSTGALVSGW